MPWLRIVEAGVPDKWINCNHLPPPVGGGPGTLEIPGVELKHDPNPGGTPYDFVSIPIQTTAPSSPGQVITIQLQGPLQPDSMILPYNGGVPLAEISIKTI